MLLERVVSLSDVNIADGFLQRFMWESMGALSISICPCFITGRNLTVITHHIWSTFHIIYSPMIRSFLSKIFVFIDVSQECKIIHNRASLTWNLYFFFWGTLFLRKLYLKNFNIKNKNNKISQGRGNSLRNEVRGGVELCSPDPLKPLPTGLENTERIASLNSNSYVLTEPVRLPGVPCRLDKAAAYCPYDYSSGLTYYTPIVSTAIGSNWCASARAAYLRRLRSSALFAAMPASIADLFRCTPAKVSTHVQSHTKLLPPLKGKTVIPSGRDPSPLSNPGGSKTDGRPAFWSALLATSFIAECLGKRPALYLQDKPCKPLLSILPPQRQEWGAHKHRRPL